MCTIPALTPSLLPFYVDTGLSNRLRVLAAYMWIGHASYGGAHVAFIWDKNEACPGHFLQVFEPINTVIFATNMSRYVLDKHAKIVYENSNAVFTWTMQMNNIPRNRFGSPTWGQIEHMMYSRYIPTKEVLAKITNVVNKYGICNCSAMHIRATDLAAQLARKKKPINIDSYFHFVDSRLPEENVYLLTDSPTIQQQFLAKYGSQKIIVYDIIPDPSHAAQLSTSSEPVPEDRRFTTLEHTVVDVFIAAHAKSFKGAAFSSLSDLVEIFNRIGKKDRGWCR
jgi:hypothetical protein